ncbi:FeoB-associated Cys-rich membrane protein [Paenibacillus dendritiformis]|nr:FeoB-associated Cys-rich membrane protein [Paenibacillus dendritiformis]PZM67467.1 FeoB-associated Cys-rich membrane protein [Paenibacillus dendritiformis]TDL57554.1 FeoB-associated Cys-rich membrane protein [Paenibacillus dendritiformis]CAH8772482.1 FeoB-associated Cys-rich membrane protein [Paenibacillus dendritiformis]
MMVMPWFEIALVSAIFGYAGWTLIRHIRKSKQGACASCALNRSCPSGSCASAPKPEQKLTE